MSSERTECLQLALALAPPPKDALELAKRAEVLFRFCCGKPIDGATNDAPKPRWQDLMMSDTAAVSRMAMQLLACRPTGSIALQMLDHNDAEYIVMRLLRAAAVSL